MPAPAEGGGMGRRNKQEYDDKMSASKKIIALVNLKFASSSYPQWEMVAPFHMPPWGSSVTPKNTSFSISCDAIQMWQNLLLAGPVLLALARHGCHNVVCRSHFGRPATSIPAREERDSPRPCKGTRHYG